MVGGDCTIPRCFVQRKGGVSARTPRPRGGSLVAPMEHHVGLQCGEGFSRVISKKN